MCNVSEGASEGTPVCVVTASDVDTGTFADITYSSDCKCLFIACFINFDQLEKQEQNITTEANINCDCEKMYPFKLENNR